MILNFSEIAWKSKQGVQKRIYLSRNESRHHAVYHIYYYILYIHFLCV